ncbi:hypothetical protein D3C72_1860740 [compost metagenome]
MQALTIGGEIELFLALFGHTDIRDHRIVFAGSKPQRPVRPGHRHQFQIEAEAVGHRKGIIRVCTDHSFCIRRIGRKRWPTGCDRDGEFARRDEFEILGNSGNSTGVFFNPDAAWLVRRQIEDIRCKSRCETGNGQKSTERGRGETRGESHCGFPIE